MSFLCARSARNFFFLFSYSEFFVVSILCVYRMFFSNQRSGVRRAGRARGSFRGLEPHCVFDLPGSARE